MNRKSRSTAGRAAFPTSLMLALAAIVIVGIAPATAPAQSPETRAVEVTPEKGSAPLGVILTGPPSFVAQAHDFMFTHGACSATAGAQVFTIDWGDDPEKTSAWPSAANPECRLTHDYTAPGTYKIRVGFFKPGVGGASPEPEWLGEALITVTGP